MSKGSPIVAVRLSPLVYAAVLDAVANYPETRKSGAMTLSKWIQEAIASKLNHKLRSKKASIKKVLANREVKSARGSSKSAVPLPPSGI